MSEPNLHLLPTRILSCGRVLSKQGCRALPGVTQF